MTQPSPEPDSTLRDKLATRRTQLANERTLLAYVRTAIMLIASGVTLWKLEFDSVAGRWSGIILVLLGGVVAGWGGSRFLKTRRSLG